MKKNILTILALFFVLLVSAQNDTLHIRNLTRDQILHLSKNQLTSLPIEDLLYLSNKLGISMDELLNMGLVVSSKKELTPRESPGIVSVISHEEIIKSGARDLIDVLSLVPGFSFGYDVESVVGLALRGNWGLEGKILVLLDGQEFNEGMYGVVNVGNHFSPDQIERIEIIRGPGSSLYGGYAELGVINIITRNAPGINIHTTYGNLKGTSGHRNAGIEIGKSIGKTEISASGFYGKGHRSEKDLTDFKGDIYDMGDWYSRFESKNLNVGIRNQGFSCRFIIDNYETHVEEYAKETVNKFNSILADVSYQWRPSDKLQLAPRISLRRQMPYNLEDTAYFYRRRFTRWNNEINLNYEPTKQLNIIGGVGYYNDYAKDKDEDEESVFVNGQKTVQYSNFSAYLQGLYKLGKMNIVAGGRFDYHNHAGTNFAPRVGITSILNNFHYKILLSKAFRTPSIENLDVNPDISSEHTTVIELETGYKLNANMFLTANVFDITIKNPIIYEYDPQADADLYYNYTKTGSRGFEFQYNIRYSAFSLNASYSYYNSKDKNAVDSYRVFDSDSSVLDNILQGMPAHKVTLSAIINITPGLSINPSFVLWGKRYGFIDSDITQSEVSPTPVLNIFIDYTDAFVKGLSIGAGIYNAFDKDWAYIQPYGTTGNGVKPYPAPGREILIKMSFSFGAEK
jgi:outer membrane cobalamin receptor